MSTCLVLFFAQFYFPLRLSTCLTFWIFAQFYFPPRLSTCLIFWIFAQPIILQADKWRACQAAPAFILQTNAKNKLILKVPPWLLFCIAFFPTALAFFVSQSLCALIFLALLLILVLFTFLATPFALLIFAPTALQFFPFTSHYWISSLFLWLVQFVSQKGKSSFSSFLAIIKYVLEKELITQPLCWVTSTSDLISMGFWTTTFKVKFI